MAFESLGREEWRGGLLTSVLHEDADFEEVFLDSTVARAYQRPQILLKKGGTDSRAFPGDGLAAKIHVRVEESGQLTQFIPTGGKAHNVTHVQAFGADTTRGSLGCKAYDADVVPDCIESKFASASFVALAASMLWLKSMSTGSNKYSSTSRSSLSMLQNTPTISAALEAQAKRYFPSFWLCIVLILSGLAHIGANAQEITAGRDAYSDTPAGKSGYLIYAASPSLWVTTWVAKYNEDVQNMRKAWDARGTIYSLPLPTASSLGCKYMTYYGRLAASCYLRISAGGSGGEQTVGYWITPSASPLTCGSGSSVGNTCYTIANPPATCSGVPDTITCEIRQNACLPGSSDTNCPQTLDPKNLGLGNSCLETPNAGNPVRISTGNKLQIETDYQAAGAQPLTFQRIYNSNSAYQVNTFGKNWVSTFDRQIKLYQGGGKTIAALYRADGKILYYTLQNNLFTSTSSDNTGQLSFLQDTGGLVIGYLFKSAETDEIETYDAMGQLNKISFRSGVTQSVSYDNFARVSSVTDSFQRITLNFTYDNKNRLILVGIYNVGSISYAYDANNNLISVTYPDQKTRQYLYEDSAHPNALTGILDENGTRFATWLYDAQGRALSSEHAGGAEKVSFTYGANSTGVTNALGATRTYNFSTILGVLKSIGQDQPAGAGCGPASSNITYDANGNLSSRTDFNGNVTTYQYDLTRNLETRRIEAAGTPQERTITTEWHPTYRLPTRMAEPVRITIHSYDAKGNLLSKSEQATKDTTGAQGFTATAVGITRASRYTYNDVSQVLTATDPNGNMTSYSYDSQGNLVSVRNAAGHVTSLSNYDANGRARRIVDPNGVTTELTYSPRGWLTSRKVGGELTTYGYDGVGQLTKVTHPDGSFLAYTYDAAHRLTEVADSAGDSIHYTLDAMGNRITEQARDANGMLARQITRAYDALNRLQQITGGGQ